MDKQKFDEIQIKKTLEMLYELSQEMNKQIKELRTDVDKLIENGGK